MYNPEESVISIRWGDIDPPYAICQKRHNEAHRTLGVRLPPDRKWSGEIQWIRMKIARFTSKPRTNILTTHDARIALNTMFEPNLFYSCGVTWLTALECDGLH